MSNQYFNFYYSPLKQGFDSATWRTLFGTPTISSNRLTLTDAAIIHWGDILRGDAVFGINIDAPTGIQNKKFGFWQPNKNAYAYFCINAGVLTAMCSDGLGHSTSQAITWQTAWTNADVEFRVQWEAGTVTFYIGGLQQAIIQDASVTGDPMSIYLYASNEVAGSLYLNYVDVKSIQSYLKSEGNANSPFTMVVVTSDAVSVGESTTATEGLVGINLSDSITLTESKTVGTPA